MKRSCQRCRRDLPARDAGSLSALEQQWVDAHLESCPACRAVRASLSAALEAGRAFRPTPTPAQRDALYQALRRPARMPPSSMRRAAPWLWRAAIAAGLLAAVDVAEPRRGVTPATLAAPPPPAPSPAADYELHRPAPELELLVAPGTSWRVSLTSVPWRLTLERGALFVHFHGRPGQELVADAPGLTVRVTGTVFKLATAPQGSEVGVLEGRVIVSPSSAAPVPLAAGQARAASGDLRPVASGDQARVASWLETAPPAVAAPRPATPVVPPAPRVHSSRPPPAAPPPPPGAIYLEAEDAMRAGDEAAAAAALEELVRTRPGSPQATSARLDLARLYAWRLGRRDRAIALLREVVAAAPSPSDVLAAERLLDVLVRGASTHKDPPPGRPISEESKGGTP